MKMKINKKGVEQPQVIVYVIFVIILTIAGIYVSFTKLGGVDITFEFHDFASRLNVVSTKLMFTPECYAVESNYTAEDKILHYQINGGIIDLAKFNKTNTNIIDSKCLSGEKQVWASLKEINKAYNETVWSCPGGRTSCTEPLWNERTDSTLWNKQKRSFFVLIKNGNKLDKGILTVQMKE